MSREDFVGQTRDVFDNKRSTVFCPADYLIVGRVLSGKGLTSMMRKVFARKMGILLRISSRLRYEGLVIIINIMTYKSKPNQALMNYLHFLQFKEASFLKFF